MDCHYVWLSARNSPKLNQPTNDMRNPVLKAFAAAGKETGKFTPPRTRPGNASGGLKVLPTSPGCWALRYARLGCLLGGLLALSPAVCLQAENSMDLGRQTVTFTNLQGRVYQDVQLERATQDGLIYSQTNTGAIGMVHYSDVSPDFLTGLKIPESLVAAAAQRQNELTLAKIRYAEEAHQLALQQLTNSSPTNAVAKTPEKSATPAPAPQKTATATHPAHHRRRG